MNDAKLSAPFNGHLIHVNGMVQDYPDGNSVLHILKDINLEVAAGEILAIMGPSGSGKSTLLYILGLLLKPTRGSYYLLGEDVLRFNRSQQAAYRRQCLGFVFQSCDLIESSTVYENLEFPLIYAGVERKRRPEWIASALKRVNLSHRIYHRTNRLSGGEQQRVAVARALVNNPRIILADEPTGHLDRANGQLVLEHFEEFVSKGKNAVVIVTHDPEIANRCHRTYVIMDGIFLHESNKLVG
jgi:putative ABC transport system ATP-binding protein